MKKLILLSILLVSPAIVADEISLILGGWSKHTTTRYETVYCPCPDGRESVQVKYDYNETNEVIGIVYNNFTFATFKNSYYNSSYLLGYNNNISEYSNDHYSFKFSVLTGVVVGYTPDQVGHAYLGHGLSFMLQPNIENRYKFDDKLSISLITGAIGISVLTNTLQLNYTF